MFAVAQHGLFRPSPYDHDELRLFPFLGLIVLTLFHKAPPKMKSHRAVCKRSYAISPVDYLP